MAFLTYEGVGITAMAAAVPRCVVDNYKYTQYFPEDQVKEVVDKIGIYERRFADADTCSSDLCFAAAERLIEDNGINKEEIDLLVFISQTPDYRMPATSVILQDRLKLSHSCVAFDISLGCSALWPFRGIWHDAIWGDSKSLDIGWRDSFKGLLAQGSSECVPVWRRWGGCLGGAR